MQIGYARVSTADQTLALQKDALTAAKCAPIYTDTMSGTKDRRPGLEQALSHLRAGDTLVVWRLDRLGRSLKHLIDTIQDLEQRGVGFKSLTENIDTTTPGGKLIFHIFGSLAEFERALIVERTQAGLTAARARGRKGGRPRGSIRYDPKKLALAQQLYDERKHSVAVICKTLGIARTTFYRYLSSVTKQTDENRMRQE
ncbi:MAG TPA: recombinase family protein [Ktedonobacteraceae bacterium]|nr:recombinase family protein [Ktedonobacteraceae bacterium]